MHQCHYTHRDLKPENFIFTTKEGLDQAIRHNGELRAAITVSLSEAIEKSVLKLIDFGLAREFQPEQVLTTKAGTPYYVAPQVLAGKYDHMADMWSLGVIMYVMLCGYPPFYGESDQEVLDEVRQGKVKKNVSEDAKALIKNLLQMNPKERYTAEQALNDVWIKEKAPKAKDVNLQDGFVDKNGDGLLTAAELKAGLEKGGLKDNIPGDLQEIMKSIDADGSGVIDYTEFLAATLDRKHFIEDFQRRCLLASFPSFRSRWEWDHQPEGARGRRVKHIESTNGLVPPWAAAGCDPKPQVKLKPLSPVKRQRCSGPLLSRLRSKDGDDMLATVLNSILPVPSQSSGKHSPEDRDYQIDPREGSEGWSPSVGSPAKPSVFEFLGVLTRRFGNLTRAFRAMKRAAGKGKPRSREAEKPRSREAEKPQGKPRSREATGQAEKPRSREAEKPQGKPRSREAKKLRSREATRQAEKPRSREATRQAEKPRSREGFKSAIPANSVPASLGGRQRRSAAAPTASQRRSVEALKRRSVAASQRRGVNRTLAASQRRSVAAPPAAKSAAMNRAEGIGLCDFIEYTPEGLLSLQQVRQQLLEEWSREELEEILQSHQQDEVSKQDFMNIAEDLGIESSQAWHLFELLEDSGHGGLAGRGCIRMADLHEAVLSDEIRLLWHDLWKQLVARFGSIRDALRILESCVHSVHSPKCHVDEDTFSTWMESWNICRDEAAEYFNFLGAEGDSDGSESNLLEKLKNSLQSAAPKTSLEDFWQRVAAEWPELLEAAHAKSAPGRLADLLLELLPVEMRLIMKQMRQGSRGSPRKVSGSHRRPQVTEHSTSGNVQSQSPLSLLSLDLEAFTALAIHIDVSPENSKELFESIARSASGAQSSHEDIVPEAQIYLDDFAEQMILWTEGVDRRGPMKEKIQQLQHFRFAPVRAVISALKAELLPAPAVSETPESKLPKLKERKEKKQMKQRPQLPWCTYYHLRPNPAAQKPVKLNVGHLACVVKNVGVTITLYS
eukprot:s25_g36.t1